MKINKNKVKVVLLCLLALIILTLIAAIVYSSSSKEEKSIEDKQKQLSVLLENSHQKSYKEMKTEQHKLVYMKYEKGLNVKRERIKKEALAKKREERRIYLEQKKLARENEAESRQQREKLNHKVASSNKVSDVSRSSGHQSSYEITNYTSRCNGCSGISASGVNVSNTIYHQGYRIVAASPSLPFYTKLKIRYSNGTVIKAIVLDRGSAIQGKILDLLVSSNEEAYRLGRQQVTVEIIN